MRRQVRVLQHALQDCRHALIVTAQRWVVRYSKRQDVCHDVLAVGVSSSPGEMSGCATA
jgi:hypothetical protein